ncbi:MAG TPA: 4-alpha-glucanotransferase [Myxococcales bacterium]|nr:4-alpha-glucanotransferase [Myxococcales bacterium]
MAHRFNLGRRAGLLLPLSAVRGPAGDLGSYADAGRVAEWLLSAGCSLWQLLPLNEVSPGQDSPYSASSSCALEPVFIDLSAVPDLDGLSHDEEQELLRLRREPRVDFEACRKVKRGALSRAFRRFLQRGGAGDRDLQAFRAGHAAWIEDWALYRALHEERRRSWRDWEAPLRDREPAALAEARARLRERIDELCYVQWIADSQWRKGRAQANAKGVKVLGDLPFMVAGDSADVWSFQRFFRFDANVGVPPDAYSAEGQDWGLPVPRWEEMRSSGDPWLHQRAERAAELYDAFRVDHVVGLYRTYARPLDKSAPFFIPADEVRQKQQGERILQLLGEKAEVLAEDLGTVPDFVRASLAAQEIPGTKVLRWENDQGVPRDVTRFSHVSVAVTGTHDTEALASWWEGLESWEREHQLAQPQLAPLRGPEQEQYTPQTRSALLALAYAAASDALLIPVTDALGWRERMNTPGTVGPHNWTFRLPWTLEELFSAPEAVAAARELAHLGERHGRKV